MKKSPTVAAFLAIGALFVSACSAPAETSEKRESIESIESREVKLDEQSADVLRGSLVLEDLRAEFTARRVSDTFYTIEILRNGITLTADFDYETNRFRFDGFGTETGQDTVLNDDDKLVLEALGKAISDKGLATTTRDPLRRGVIHKSPGAALVSALSTWHLTPVNAELRRDLKAEVGRTIKYLCGYLSGYGVQATHDCWDCWDRWDGWSYVNIGPNDSASNCYPDSCGGDCANSYSCGRMSCEQGGGGGNGNYQWGSNGDKYGSCTVWDTNKYVEDCLDHDHCVRNDHGTGSGWCSDEAASATDDQPGASDCIMKDGCAGACGGYSQNGCWCDSACDTYGDCCMDKVLQCGTSGVAAGSSGSSSGLGRYVARTYGYASRGGYK